MTVTIITVTLIYKYYINNIMEDTLLFITGLGAICFIIFGISLAFAHSNVADGGVCINDVVQQKYANGTTINTNVMNCNSIVHNILVVLTIISVAILILGLLIIVFT